MSPARCALPLLICRPVLPALPGQSAEPVAPAGKPPALDAHGDPLPPLARARLGTLRFRQGSRVNWVRFSPDGRTLLTIDWDAVGRVWEPATGKELYHFTLPDPYQYEWFLTPDHSRAVTWGKNRPIRVWDTASGKAVREIASEDHQLGPACLTDDGKTLVTWMVDRKTKKAVIRFWDVASGTQLRDILPNPVKGEDND